MRMRSVHDLWGSRQCHLRGFLPAFIFIYVFIHQEHLVDVKLNKKIKSGNKLYAKLDLYIKFSQ
jgi:hypothetical protein